MRPGALAVLALALGTPAWAGKRDSALVEQLDREVIALREQNKVLEGKLASCGEGALDTELYAQLKQVYSGTEVQVSRVGARSVLIIPGELLFAPGGIAVREEATMVTDLLATALGLHPDMQVWVIGYTDDDTLSGTLRRRFGDNWGLSTARAAAFKDVLVNQFGIAQTRFTIAGCGATHPIASNDTPEGRAKNRRIVVVIGPAEDFR